jgi:flagellar secretion chaperone FliS
MKMSAYPRSQSLAAYQSVAVHSGVAAADPHRLIVLLLDGALDRIAQARGAIGNGSQESKARLIHRAVAIIDELRGSLNFEAGGDIAANLGALYDYAGRQLMKANLESRIDLLEEVASLLRQVRGAWVEMPGSTRRVGT